MTAVGLAFGSSADSQSTTIQVPSLTKILKDPGKIIDRFEEAGRKFNMGSPKQIGAIFFEEKGLPVVAKTPKGAPSTSESVLQQLADQGHDLPRIILEHRGLAKLKSVVEGEG